MGFVKAIGVAVLGGLLSFAAVAQHYVEGEHYLRLDNPLRTDNPDKIEVAEVFWYGCPHCYSFESVIEPWKAAAPDDVNFVGVPAMWQEPAGFNGGKRTNVMELHARAYYTAKALGVLDKLHAPMFEALHQNHNALNSEAAIAALFADHGVDKEKFAKTFNSFPIINQTLLAYSHIRGYRVTGTPEIVVDGTYRISGRTAGSNVEMLKVVDFLVEKIRAEKQ